MDQNQQSMSVVDVNSKAADSSGDSTTLYVLVPPSPLFAAHWSFFIPNGQAVGIADHEHSELSVGRRVHVAGDRLNGFALEIIRDYDVVKHKSVGPRRYPIAVVPGHFLSRSNSNDLHDTTKQEHEYKDEDEGGGHVDNRPIDDFEMVCVEVQAPGPSLNRIASRSNGKMNKVGAKDCQWWIREVVKVLTERDMLEPYETGLEPADALSMVPQH